MKLCLPQIWCSLVQLSEEQILEVCPLEKLAKKICYIIDKAAVDCSITVKFGTDKVWPRSMSRVQRQNHNSKNII